MKGDKKPLDLLPVKEGVIPVDEWKPTAEDECYIKYVGKTIVIPFNKYINCIKSNKRNIFYVSHKDSYVKKFAQITHYLNYFIRFYDDDNELILNYLYCKYMLDKNKVSPNRENMIRWLYEHFVTPTMYKKVKRFVEDNYRIDLAQNKDPSKQYSESLEFTNRHAKLFLVISTFIKMLIPLVMHYISIIAGKPEAKHLIEYYKPLFEIIERVEHVNLYAKLFHSINVKVNFNESKNKVIWAKYAANSVDTVSYTEELLDKNLIVDNVFKYVFDKSIISFNSVILDTQLDYRCIKNFGINMREISTEKDSDGLSYLDKLEMNTVKIDENIILLSQTNIDDTIKRIRKSIHIKISKDERHFYEDNMRINKISKSLVFYFYSRMFGGFADLNHITQKQYIKLMVLMKFKLLSCGYVYLPRLISANIEGRINSRTIHNSKFLESVETSAAYENIVKEKYATLINSGKGDLIISLLSTLINTQFTYCEYDEPRLLGKVIDMNHVMLSQEFLDFVNII